ncbi:MAG: transposase [Acidobacteriota bacterium]|nr:transposase [Blastocatellia bacterium]MDW8241063.1 transposase [Acidobacteriota bacterium]
MDTLFPAMIITYLGQLAPVFSANHFVYFRGFVLAMMLLGQTRKCVTNVARVCFFVNRHVSSWERFLSQAQWELNQVRDRVLGLIQQRLGPHLLMEGAYLAWVDTTLIAKVKGRMPGVQTWHDHNGNPEGTYLVGHHWALVGLMGAMLVAGTDTSLCWPLLANLIPGQSHPLGFIVNPQGVARAMTFWDAVCPLLAQLHQMLGRVPLRVVPDAYFCKAPFLNWTLSLPVHVITRMRRDAVGWDDPEPEGPPPPGPKKRTRKPTKPRKGRRWKLADLLLAFPTDLVTVTVSGQAQTHPVVTRDLWITDVTQKVRVVVIQMVAEPLILLSTDLTLSPPQIIHLYARRFPLELAIRDLKQHFGLGDYQCTSGLALSRFVGLALISFCLWRLVLLYHPPADWLQSHHPTAPLSLTNLSRAVRRLLIGRIFHTSAAGADLPNSPTVPQELFRLIV